MNKENQKFFRGSEWRKWDLHVHTPSSILNNGFGEDWDIYVSNLFKKAILCEIAVIGITDYFHIEGYKKVKDYLANKEKMESLFTEEELVAISKILIVPNIEFRLFPINRNRLNFHVIFSDKVSVQDIEENFLHNLHFVREGEPFENDEKRKLKISNLSELGKKLKKEHVPFQDRPDLFIGMLNAVVSDEEISTELVAGRSIFPGKYVLVLPSDEDLSTIPWDGQDHNTRKKIIQKSNFLFTSNRKTIDWGLGKMHLKPETFKAEFKSYKPCIWGSDAHDFDKLFEPDKKCYCWIKADPTFAGLRQILNEPENRVFIGELPPNYKHEHQVIKKISIPKSNDWFEDNFELELNRDLVTIIGGRGSGKSALAEMIAYGAGIADEGEEAFISKASEHIQSIKGTEITLTWGDGHPTSFVVGDLKEDKEDIRYLSQKEIERLCSHKNSKKLLEQIENVIFQALDETEKMGASSFSELSNKILKNFGLKKDREIKKIRENIKKLASILESIKQNPVKEKLLIEKQEELKKLKDTLPILPAEDKKGQDELAGFIKQKKAFDDKIIDFQGQTAELSEASTKIKIFQEDTQKFEEDISTSIRTLLPEIKKFSVNLDISELETAITTKDKSIKSSISVLRTGTKKEVADILGVLERDLYFDNLNTLTVEIKKKQEDTKASETIKIKYQHHLKLITELEAVIKSLEVEIKIINDESIPEAEKLREACTLSYCTYFSILKQEKTEIEKLYLPLQKSLDAGTDTDKKLEFEAKLNYELEKHTERGLNIVDRTRKGNFKDKDSVQKALESLGSNLRKNDFIEEVIKEELLKVEQQFKNYNGKDHSIEEQLREGYSLADFYEWIFDPTNFKVVSTIKFDNTDLYLLSPGKKGIVLLILFLQIDEADNRPLIIDQPEENLDNLSVYQDLITYFKSRKQNRQIIIITHNPNLVVNTDAEQVIIANYDGSNTPRIQYSSGSLENQAEEIEDVEIEELEDGIIEKVCKILEGGETAFDNRKRKYDLSIKNFKKL